MFLIFSRTYFFETVFGFSRGRRLFLDKIRFSNEGIGDEGANRASLEPGGCPVRVAPKSPTPKFSPGSMLSRGGLGLCKGGDFGGLLGISRNFFHFSCTFCETFDRDRASTVENSIIHVGSRSYLPRAPDNFY